MVFGPHNMLVAKNDNSIITVHESFTMLNELKMKTPNKIVAIKTGLQHHVVLTAQLLTEWNERYKKRHVYQTYCDICLSFT